MDSHKSLFYLPNASAEGSRMQFGPDESKHMARVLRLNTGDTLVVTDGKGLLFESRILKVTAEGTEVLLQRLIERQQVNPAGLHLAIAPTKNADRTEWLAEKAVEAGISRITLLRTARTESRGLKQERLEKIMLAAMKQSQRLWLPELSGPADYNSFINSGQEGAKYIAHLAEGERILLNKVVKAGEGCTVLIGPEGDFTQPELDSAFKAGYLPVSLGPVRLRTETAGLAACFMAAFAS